MFFVFGTAILSIGYKWKIRIDYVILFLLVSIYLAKIISYFSYSNAKDYFTTLYFYLFNYGEIILNPLFNLNYYLIGIFYGLVNFSIQKGVTIYKNAKKGSYAMIELLDEEEDKNIIKSILNKIFS